jgi:hypothetical protein
MYGIIYNACTELVDLQKEKLMGQIGELHFFKL